MEIARKKFYYRHGQLKFWHTVTEQRHGARWLAAWEKRTSVAFPGAQWAATCFEKK
jgi:hypothetical protein